MLEQFECCGLTDRGKERRTNQDHFLIADLVKTMRINDTSIDVDSPTWLTGHSQGKVLLVADGMGGHQAGDRASSLAIETLNTYLLNTMHWFFRLEADREHDFELDLKAALATCHEKLRAESAAMPDEYGMGTTLTMAYLIWPRMYVVHAGDSRCYLLRKSTIQQITTDHTFAQKFVEAGALAADEAEETSWSHMLWNVVGGTDDKLQPVVYKSELFAGDMILICSDGLTCHLSDDELVEVLSVSANTSVSDMCQQLVQRANDAGGRDNITAVLARC